MGNRQNQLIMLKLHLFPRESGKDTVLGPPKLPSGFALGQFWRPSDGIFSRIPRKKVEFWPRAPWAEEVALSINMSGFVPLYLFSQPAHPPFPAFSPPLPFPTSGILRCFSQHPGLTKSRH